MTNRVAAAWAVALGLALVAPVPAATAADVKDKAVETKDTLKEKAVDAKDTIKEKAVDAKDAIKEKTAEVTDKIKSKFDRNKDRTATVDQATTMSVREAQSSLKAKGFDPGPIDGIHGPRTRAAVEDFQRSENLMVTGQLDADTSARLSLTASRGGHTDSTAPSASPTTDRSLKDKAVDTKDSMKEKAVDAKDTMKEKAVEAKDTIKEKAAAVKDKVKAKLSRDNDRPMAAMDVRQAQSSLKAKGFDPGPIDGVFGPRTRAAVQDFQRSEGLTITGQLDAETSARLSGTSQSVPATPSASPATTMEPAKDQPAPSTGRATQQRSRQAP